MAQVVPTVTVRRPASASAPRAGLPSPKGARRSSIRPSPRKFTLPEGPAAPRQREPNPEAVVRALTRTRLFAGCAQELADAVGQKAERRQLRPGEALDMEDGGPLIIVESGAVSVRVGGRDRPAVVFGPGEAFNFVGLLMLNSEVEPFRPINRGKGAARSGLSKDASAAPPGARPENMRNIAGAYDSHSIHNAPFLFQDSRRRKREAKMLSSIEKGEVSPDDALCFY
ncbi:unnamed protein product, partial [Prorocentrum cordatum]